MATDMDKYYKAVDDLSSSSKERLGKAIEIQSVSADNVQAEMKKMADFLVTELKAVGADAETKELNDKKLPHVVVARYPANPDSSKRTILIYGHYDVQPKGEGWKHEPFKMKEEDGKLFGRGSTDDKGPVIAWINVIEAYKKSGVQFPVNVRFCFEGMEESGSTGLPEFLDSAEGKQLFDKVDAGCISDNYWLGTKKPCLTYGLRGINYFSITVSGPPKQLHSGIFGGSVYEPLTDLIILLSKLVDSQGKILVPGIEKIIEPLTDEEKKLYDGIDYSLKDFNDSIGPKSDCGIYNDPKQILMARWRYPSLSIHGISGAYSGDQTVTSIPPNVTGKFSIRTVPNMTNDRVTELVKNYLNVEFEKLNSKNHLTVKLNDKGEWWRTDPQAQNFKAAVSATRDIWEQVIPDLTREGGSIPVTMDIQKGLGDKSLMLLPIGTTNDGAHGPDENIPTKNYINGIKVLGAYLHHFATQI